MVLKSLEVKVLTPWRLSALSSHLTHKVIKLCVHVIICQSDGVVHCRDPTAFLSSHALASLLLTILCPHIFNMVY